jgi:PAS domain S-box-containing protein
MISVLCVDDEPGLLKIAKIFLERDKDLTVKTVTSAIEGLSVISIESFDAIVSDYQMPEMDGIEFLKRVRLLHGVPFILFTGRGREEVAIEAINNGVDFYLQKGLEPKSQFAELAHKIKHAVQKRRLEELLVKSEQKFHTFADYTHDWEYWQSEDNAYVYISPSCEQITGYISDEFNADPNLLSSIIFPDDRNKWTNHSHEETQLKSPLSLEFRIVRKDGEIRWISHRCQPVTDTNGKLLGRRTGNRDITRQKQDEEKIFVAYKQLAAQGELLKQQYGFLRMTDIVQKESTRFLDDIFSSIQDGISVLDQDLTVLKVNSTMERWYAHSMPVVGKKCYEAYHARTEPCETCPTLQTLRTGKATMETIPKMGPDSTITGWLDLYSFPLIDSQTGKMNGIIEYVRDISQRRQAEEEMAVSEERYRGLFESSKDGILILDFETGSIIDANPSFLAILGFSREGLLGKTLPDIGLLEDTSLAEKIFLILKKEEYVRYENISLLAKDGSSVAVDFVSNVYTVNQSRVIQCTIRNISEPVKTESDVHDSEEQFRTIIETANEGIWIMDERYITTLINPRMAQILGYSQEEMIGHLVTDFMFAEDLPAHRQRMASRIMGKPDTYEQKFRHKNGNAVLCQVSATPRVGNLKEFRGSVAMISDITERKRAEESLQESETRLRSIIRASPVGIGLVSNRVLIEINDRVSQMTGYTKDELIGQSARILYLTPEEFDRVGKEKYADIEKTGTGIIETRWKRKDGSIIEILLSSTPLNPADLKAGVTFTALDITARKRAEEALRESGERFRNLIHNSSDMIHIIGSNGLLAYISPSTPRIVGYEQSDVIGKDPLDYVHPDDRQQVKGALGEVFSKTNPGTPTEYRMRHADGHYIDVETIATNLLHVPGIDGVVITTRPITERKNVERALRESEAKYRDLVENANTIIMQTNTTGKITYFNEFAQKFFGFSDQEIIGHSLIGTIMPETESVTGRDLGYIVENELLHPEKYALHESEIIKKDGGRFWVAWRNKPLYDESGKISGIVRFGLDISDRRKAEEALFQTNKKLNLLSSITRHDILNQLTALSGYIELSKEATQDKKMLDFFDREKRATNTIQRLITFTKDYQDIGQYRPMWQNIQTIVHLLAKTVELNSTNLIINLSHLEIFADPLLEKVVYTLLENAMRHGGSLKSIRFSYQLVDKGCLILCEDDGTGIADADKEKIFERGYGKHTGFGLFLSREILGITGFSIKETGTPGKGARFEIFVPNGSFRLEEKIPEAGN